MKHNLYMYIFVMAAVTYLIRMLPLTLIIGSPANYLKYYIGYLKFYELKKEMADALGNQFSQKEFHRAVLDVGPAPFEIVYDEVKKNLLD